MVTISKTILALSHLRYARRQPEPAGALQGYATTRCGYIAARGIVGTEQGGSAPQRPKTWVCASRDLAMAPDSGLAAAEG